MSTITSSQLNTRTALANATTAHSKIPNVWLVVGDKLGDNAQVEAIADALDWPCVRKRLVFRDAYVVGKPAFRPDLYHINKELSDPLAPPWPDLVLTVGRRPSMVALWIKMQSGGRTRIVIVGRPRSMLREFDLVIATPQYRLPAQPNVMHIDLPLMRVNQAAVASQVALWEPRLKDLKRPLTAVLVGGPTKPFRFDTAVVKNLVERINQSGGDNGTLFISTSRRTPPDVVDALQSLKLANVHLFRWQPGTSENPYHALLGLADRFVVTGDSISMIVEVARMGKPLAIFPLPEIESIGRSVRRWLSTRFQPEPGGRGQKRYSTRIAQALYDLGLIAYSREFSAFHNRLVERGVAVWLGQPFPEEPPTLVDDLQQVATRVRALLEPPS